MLLEPVLQSHPAASARRAWPLRPQLLVALAGGLLAFAPLAIVNARRLALPRRSFALVAAAVGAGCVVAAVVALGSRSGYVAALLVWDRPAAVLAALVTLRLQGRYDRAYHFYRDGAASYARVAPVAVAAVVGAAAVQVALALAAHAGWAP